MRLIVGLGNPGTEYSNTRHNAGFLALERYSMHLECLFRMEAKFDAKMARAVDSGCSVLLCQPQTFMNASGMAVGKVVDYFRVPINDLLVVADDADLGLGTIRLRPGGRSGGHNGLKSIARALGNDRFARLKIGIGRREEGRLHKHVLGRFGPDERGMLDRVLERVVDQVRIWTAGDIDTAMNRFNGQLPNEQQE